MIKKQQEETMNKFTLFVISMMLGISVSAHAVQTPQAGRFDGRVKSVIYNSEQVIKIIGHYGYSTHIEFSPFETVQNIAMGDSDAWDIAPTGNHIFLKPKAKKAATNMTIITNKRVYNFDLDAKKAFGSHYLHSNNMYYQINFIYPDEIAQRQKNQEEATKLRHSLSNNHDIVPLNWNYWSKGTAEIKPVKVFDDGRFTYMTFSQQSDMPAIYMLGDDDKETLINTSINPQSPNTLIIQKVTHRMLLRHGNALVLIVNQSYDPTNPTAYKQDTTMPMVDRVIKERQ
jgi:type IV secretion system protein VirB9